MEPPVADKSPFLLRDLLLEEAARGQRDDLPLLDASRGAANWQLRPVLNAWHALGLFATEMAVTPLDDGQVALALDAGLPWGARFDSFHERVAREREALAEGCSFLARAWRYLAEEVLPAQGRDRIIGEFAEAAAGRRYSSPPTLGFVAPTVTRYLAPLLFGGDAKLAGQFDVICCEGATTGIAQVAATLARNRLIRRGDQVAMWWPTYEPLRDLVECQLGCEIVPIRRDPQAGWKAVDEDLKGLLDPRVRLAITVSPGNPVPVPTDARSLDALEHAVTLRPDLLVLADYVYAHFLDGPVETEIARMPRNTIGFYSVSKDFGLAGMRIGVILIHPDGAAQRALSQLGAGHRAEADGRYLRRALEPAALALSERIVADSRGVSFTHMSGLSTPLQALLCLCAVYDLIEPAAVGYFAWVRRELTRRVEALYDGLGVPVPDWMRGPSSRYSTTVDLTEIARARGGEELVGGLAGQSAWRFLTYLAREWQVVLTPGEGFGTGPWSARACFPSVSAEQAREVGRRVAQAVEAFARGAYQ
ncbi:MAG: aminotransferase class I/II-fold pyridoxal phosphate-dependent enzyme [Armatimonadota bacterium]